MKKRIVCLLIVCVMLLSCGCDMISGKTELPDLKEHFVSAEMETTQEPEAEAVPAKMEGAGFSSPERQFRHMPRPFSRAMCS